MNNVGEKYFINLFFFIFSAYNLDNDLDTLKLILKTKITVPYTDEGFESDPELIPTPPMSPIKWERCETPTFNLDLEAPEIPTLSDLDDDF